MYELPFVQGGTALIDYKQQKLDNAICYLASEHVKRAEKPAYQTYVYKYLAMFDFQILQKTGKPALDIEYEAYERGPVPKRLYASRHEHKGHCYTLKPEGENSIIIQPSQRANLDCFSELEIEVMNSILDEFAHPWITTDILNEASHEIRAWQAAWARRGDMGKVPMSYDDSFSALNEKEEAQLTPEEETYLTFKALKNIF